MPMAKIKKRAAVAENPYPRLGKQEKVSRGSEEEVLNASGQRELGVLKVKRTS